MNSGQKRLLTTIFLFSFLALLPMSCGLFCADSCGCGPIPKPMEIRVKSFAIQTVDASGKEIPASETKEYDQVFKTLQINEVENKTRSSTESSVFGSFGTAFACDPLSPLTENTLYLIQIINQKDFTLIDGTKYSVGDNISSLLGMNHFFAAGLTSIENFIAPGMKLSFEDYFKIGFLANPEKEINLKFSIRLVFDDAQELVLTDQILNVR